MSDSCCESTIDTSAMAARQRRVLIIVLCINLATFAMMVAGSWLSGSSALLSGTLDNLGDALTYALSLAVVGASAAAKARVALFKGALIMLAAIAVALQILWRTTHMDVPVATTMGAAAILNLLANGVCLLLLYPLRNTDLNMASMWECSRNDVFEGVAVAATAVAVGLVGAAWPDLVVATALLIMFLRSAWRVLSGAWRGMTPQHSNA